MIKTACQKKMRHNLCLLVNEQESKHSGRHSYLCYHENFISIYLSTNFISSFYRNQWGKNLVWLFCQPMVKFFESPPTKLLTMCQLILLSALCLSLKWGKCFNLEYLYFLWGLHNSPQCKLSYFIHYCQCSWCLIKNISIIHL